MIKLATEWPEPAMTPEGFAEFCAREGAPFQAALRELRTIVSGERAFQLLACAYRAEGRPVE